MTALPTSATSQPVPLRVVPSRRSPGPLPVATDLSEPGDPVNGRLLVDTTRSGLSPQLAGHDVAVLVDGERWTCGWGRSVIDLPPGRHLVEIEVERSGGWGRVSEAVPVAAGSTVPVYYRAPALPFVAGRVGPVPHRGPGPRAVALTTLAALTSLVAVVLVAIALIDALAG